MSFTFATFCFGDRYYKQVNRFIDDISSLPYQPSLVVLTDNEEMITKKDFVKTYNVNDFNSQYLDYQKNYYDFDFSVKRYAVRASVNLGFTKVILVDADMRVNPSLFNEENILNSFIENSVSGPVTYNFLEQIHSNSELGRRLLHYENVLDFVTDKEKLGIMPEDCIQYLDIEKDKFIQFLDTWDKCIEHKKNDGLRNIPAGNIDEMCFSALYNGIELGNNSNKSLNIIYAEHDKWY
ncbi:hypothetical protein UFOVP117_17 [uncultured Caudovirales phage]|uniref:Uncharacterized protein n=1 Tax=uncultured Caudovirales phage TaxID=2100421 RepID=A0A6J5L7R5_9CAUD|nr:hypothetical protein UFOVP117_17 [uncultured Caudovirales phage]